MSRSTVILAATCLSSQMILSEAADTTKPVLSGFSAPLKVAAGSRFTATVSVSDDSGIDRVLFQANPPAGMWFPCTGNFQLNNGTTFDGSWVYNCDVTADTPNGKYSYTYTAYDTAGNYAYEYNRLGFEVSNTSFMNPNV